MGKRHDLSELYITQKSLTEWLEDISHEDAVALREEDNEKRERLRVLHEISDLPFDAPVKFTAEDVATSSPKHQQFLEEHGTELCALRLIPINPSLPKLRMRGRSAKDVQAWFTEQGIDPTMYRAEYMPHSENSTWSTIFIINDNGIFGEIIRGRHSQLTQGLYDEDNVPYTFSYDFSAWKIEPHDERALSEIQKVIDYLHFTKEQQTKAKEVLKADFSSDYLKGYFETSESPEFGLWFIDYAPKMAALIGEVNLPTVSKAKIHGQVAARGNVSARAYVLSSESTVEDFPEGAILVCTMTTPELVVYMKKASAIITDQGGILSHAAIVARELGTPCIVGTKNATELIRTGDTLQIDDTSGEVIIMKKST